MPLQLNIFYTDKDGVTHDGYIVSDDVYVGDQTLTDVLAEITGERGNIIAESSDNTTAPMEITLSSVPVEGMYYFIPPKDSEWDTISWGSAGADEYGMLPGNTVVKQGQAALIKYNGGAGAESGTGAFDLIAVFSSSLDGLFTYSVTGSSGRIDVDYGDISSLDVYLGDNTCLYVSDMSDVVNISLNGSGSNTTDLNYDVVTQLNSAKHTHNNKTVLDNVTQDNIDVLSRMELDGSMLTIGNVSGTPDGSTDITLEGELNCTDIRTMYLYVSNPSNDTYTIAYDDIVNWNNKADKQNSDGGFAAGDGASAGYGGAIGRVSSATYGGAVGCNAKTSTGFAGGYEARTVDSDSNAIDAIQLGTGTNSNEKTLQVYDYQLMTADGQIPEARMSSLSSAKHTHSNKFTLDGITSTYVSNWNTAYSQRHTHSNQSVLNGISSTDITSWDNKVDTSDLPNIKKNSAATDGDIISTHLTVGSRRGDAGDGSFVSSSSSGNTASGTGSASVGGAINEVSSTYAASLAGMQNTISGYQGVALGGSQNTVPGNTGVALGGGHNTILNYQCKTGHYATDGTAGANSGTTGDAFIIGNGTSSAKSNAFRVTYSGAVYGKSTYHSTGADYAEYFEWEDGNPNAEDRRGLFVTWGNNGLVKLANNGDEILGVVSVTPSVAGNAYEDDWQGMYQTDIFGQPLSHIVHHDAEYVDVEMPDVDDEGNELETTHIEHQLLHEAYDAEEYILNPEYDSEQEYIPRSDRKEWTVVGLMGQLIVIDDGSCTVNGYCTVSKNGVGTASETGFRVLSRLDDTHIKIFVK